jgi:hypothetical protein
MRVRPVCSVLAFFLTTGNIGTLPAQRLVVKADPRAEVLAIMFRLAGAPEYQLGRIQPYMRQIDSAFRPYASEPAIDDIRRLRLTEGVGFDAVMSLAAHITDPISFAERVPFDAPRCALDPRWHGAATRPFLVDARRFARDAHVSRFLRVEQPLYDSAATRMRRMVEHDLNLKWFQRFYADRSPSVFILSPVLANADELFGPTFFDGHTIERHAYVGLGSVDKAGFAVVAPSYLPYIVHEVNHTFVNHVLDSDSAAFRPYIARVYRVVEKAMEREHYADPQIMLDESLVRAAVVRYLMANKGRAAGQREIIEQQRRGFFWMSDLVRLLGEYEARRDVYPTFAAFVPKILDYYEGLASRASK